MARVITITPAAMTREDAAAYLAISTDTLDRLRAEGRIQALVITGRIVRYTRKELDSFMERECATSSSKSQTPPTGISSGLSKDIRDARQLAEQTLRRRKGS